jgi:hypothetical protein
MKWCCIYETKRKEEISDGRIASSRVRNTHPVQTIALEVGLDLKGPVPYTTTSVPGGATQDIGRGEGW